MTPTEAHAQLDAGGWLDASRSAGVYALRVTTPPDTPRGVYQQWSNHHDHAPRWLLDGLADAVRLAYVGAASNVYDRIMDHAEGDVRQTALLRVFEPVEVLGVEPTADPFEAEYGYAREWVENGFTVYCDGMLHG